MDEVLGSVTGRVQLAQQSFEEVDRRITDRTDADPYCIWGDEGPVTD